MRKLGKPQPKTATQETAPQGAKTAPQETAPQGAKEAFIERSKKKIKDATQDGNELDVYLPVYPGATFLERQEGLLAGETPVELGSHEFQQVRRFVERRRDSEPGVIIDSHYTVVVTPRSPYDVKPEPTGDPKKDEIRAAYKVTVQPCLLGSTPEGKGIISHHETTAARQEAIIAAEMKFFDVLWDSAPTAPLQLERFCNLSGHYRISGQDKIDFALRVLRDGYGVDTENVKIEIATLDTKRPPYRTKVSEEEPTDK